MIYNVAQVAELLGCTEEIVAERIHTGDLPGVKFGRSWVIPEEALRARLNEKALAEAKERREPKRIVRKRKEPPKLPPPPDPPKPAYYIGGVPHTIDQLPQTLDQLARCRASQKGDLPQPVGQILGPE